MILLYLLTFVSTFLLAASVCPPAEVAKPCTCSGRSYLSLNCNVTEKFDLKETLKKISNNTKSAKDKSFSRLEIRNSYITELPANVTGDLTFQHIQIQAPNLTRIHWQAFHGNRITWLFMPQDNGKLESFNYPYNIFDLINSFSNLMSIYLRVPKINLIPPNAFKKNQFLKTMTIGYSNTPGLVIGDDAFYQLNLTSLDLRFAQMNFLSKHALRFQNESQLELKFNVHLSYNNLNSSSFAFGSLANFGRKTGLHLNNNQITYLNENVFKPFFNANEGSEIESLVGNPLNCTDCRNAWLVKEQDKYKLWVNDAYCGGIKRNPSLFDQKFNHCK